MTTISGTRLLFLDFVWTALYIWQLVFLFCWVFLNCLEMTCTVVPLLVYYLHGVAITSCLAFLVSVIEIVTGDSKSYFGLEASQRRQVTRLYHGLQSLLVLVHLFWFVFGWTNLLPAAIMTGLFIRFWFSFLTIALQSFLLFVVVIWYQLEVSVGDLHHQWEDLETTLVCKNDGQSSDSFPRTEE